nr:hypothetical protein [Natranaerobius trueperi]
MIKNFDNKLVNFLLQDKNTELAYLANVGLEKENIRVDKNGRLALTPHTKAFGNKLHNPYIKTDLSESQIEVITPVCNSIENVYQILDDPAGFRFY